MSQMIYKEVFERFDTDSTLCVLVRTSDGLRALAEHNFAGGVCGCCKGCSDSNELVVEKVVDMETMKLNN